MTISPSAPYVPASDIENYWHVDQRKLLVMRLLSYGLDIDRLLYIRTAVGMPGLAQRVIDTEMEWKA